MSRFWQALEVFDFAVARALGVSRKRGAVTAGAAAPRAAAAAVSEPAPLGDAALPAQVFGRAGCLWTGRARRLLEDREVRYEYVDLDAAEHARLAPRLFGETRQDVTPYVYLRGAFVGGYDALNELDRLGQLEVRASGGGATGGSVPHTRIEVAERPPEGPRPGETA